MPITSKVERRMSFWTLRRPAGREGKEYQDDGDTGLREFAGEAVAIPAASSRHDPRGSSPYSCGGWPFQVPAAAQITIVPSTPQLAIRFPFGPNVTHDTSPW